MRELLVGDVVCQRVTQSAEVVHDRSEFTQKAFPDGASTSCRAGAVRLDPVGAAVAPSWPGPLRRSLHRAFFRRGCFRVLLVSFLSSYLILHRHVGPRAPTALPFVSLTPLTLAIRQRSATHRGQVRRREVS